MRLLQDRQIVTGRTVGTAAVAVASLLWLACPAPPPEPPTGGFIKGTLIAHQEFVRMAIIPLPDLRVTVTDTATGTEVGVVSSDIDGRFTGPHVEPGEYEVCWEGDGWEPGCAPDPVEVSSLNIGLGLLQVTPKTGQRRLVHGRVRLADESRCVYRDGDRDLGDVALVHATDAGGAPVGPTIRTNRLGTYALLVDPGQTAGITAECGAAEGTETLAAGGPSGLDVVIKDRSPRIVSFKAFQQGRMVRGATAGETVELRVEARDADGDPLEATWTATGGQVTPTSSLSAEWQLPSARGTYIASTSVSRAEASGGARAEELLYFRVGEPIVHFGGTARSEGGGPLSGLSVTVDGTPLTVGPGGRFFGTIPPDPDRRYVLNIEADAHVPVSEVLDHGTRNAVYTLQQASQITFPANEGAVLRTEDEKGQGRVSIVLEGGTLVNAVNGTPAAGAVTATFAFLNPTRRPLPADYAATTEGGEDRYLDSYGAVYVDLKNAAGDPLDLAGDTRAKVSFPIPDAFVASPPAEIPIWSYDDQAGTWREEPGVIAEFDPTQGSYTALVRHFSFVNMDIAVGAAACIRVKPVFQQLPSPAPRVRVTAPQQNSGTKTKILSLDDPINAIFRLLPNQPVQLEVLDQNDVVFADLRVTDDAGVPLNANAVDPGGDITGDFDPLTWDGQYRPPAPYVECQQTVVLMSSSPNYENNGFGFLSREGAQAVVDADCVNGGCDAGAIEADAYYELVDPEDDRITLGDWWQANGFDPVTGLAGDQVEAAYLNAGDLGSGRNMRCRTDADRVACYVGNYGAFDLQPANADLAEAANQADAFATVCMEYSAVEDGGGGFIDLSDPPDGVIDGDDKIVKFFVYFGGDPGASRSNFARLDNTYARYSPRICLSCHGGEMPPQLGDAVDGPGGVDTTAVDTLAALRFMNDELSVFREFDVESFGAPSAGLDLPALTELNCDIIGDTPLPAAISELVTGWYGNCGAPGPFDGTFVPPGWGGANQPALYDGVVKKGCRACHVAQEADFSGPPDGINDFDFNAFQDWSEVTLPFVEYVVCDGYYMPHGEVPFNKLWFELTPLGQGATTLENNPLTSFASCEFTQ